VLNETQIFIANFHNGARVQFFVIYLPTFGRNEIAICLVPTAANDDD